jgi:ATP-dependent Clp protease protease subunit
MNYYIPQWEERTSYGFRRVDPYAKLFEDRIIFLGTPISDDVANAIMAQLLCLQQLDPERDISIYINSPGGSFTALTAIYDTMRYLKPTCRPCAWVRRPPRPRSCSPPAPRASASRFPTAGS